MKRKNKLKIMDFNNEICIYCSGKGKVLVTRELAKIGKFRLGKDKLQRCPACKKNKKRMIQNILENQPTIH